MASVRFSRDKRGYEHVYLIDTGRERGRSRMLYWFRSPPDVKVGRRPFDPDTQRALEAQHPDVKFNWPQIVAARIPPPVPVENWRERRRAERAAKRARSVEAAETAEAVEAVDVVELAEVSGLAEPWERGEIDRGDESGAKPAATTITDTGESLTLLRRPATEGPAGAPGSGPPKGGPHATSGGPHVTSGRRRRRRGGRRGGRPQTGAGATASVETGATATVENGDLDHPNPPAESSKEE